MKPESPVSGPVWEKSYADPDARSFGSASAEVLELIPRLPSAARVLDLGCGDGRNAIPLARAGMSVTAVDVSTAGISKLQTLAAGEGLTVSTVIGDMCSFPFDGWYDLVIAHGSLHLVPRSQWTALFEKMKGHTSQGGFNVVTVFTDSVPVPPDLEPYCLGLFKEGELFTIYSGWEMLLSRSYVFSDEHPGGVRHTHSADKLVARKAHC